MSSREPWWKCKVGLRRSSKMAALPNDSARIGWVYVLGEGKLQARLGAFLDRKALVELMGRYGRYFDDWLAVGLVEVAPKLCPRCGEKHPDAQPGEAIIHDYRREQMDPSNADRQAIWRESHTLPVRPDSNAARNGKRNAARNGKRNADLTANVTAHSRARGTTETETERIKTPTPLGAVARPTAGESREKEPRLTRQELDAWATFAEPAWAPFKAAWLARGFLHPPFGDADDDAETSQRSRLWRIAADQPAALGRWVKEAPGKTAHDVIAYVFAQRSKLAEEAGAEEAEAMAEQATHRRDGLTPLSDVLKAPADWFERPTA